MADKKTVLDRLAVSAFGRKRPEDNTCVCHGAPVVDSDFRDEISRREYRITKMCQRGQDELFGSGE